VCILTTIVIQAEAPADGVLHQDDLRKCHRKLQEKLLQLHAVGPREELSGATAIGSNKDRTHATLVSPKVDILSEGLDSFPKKYIQANDISEFSQNRFPWGDPGFTR